MHLIRRVRLRDGAELIIRPIRVSDYELELEFVRNLSATTAYQRLLSPRKITVDEIRRFVDIDYAREMALIAVSDGEDKPHQVGSARYAPEDDDSSCEVAIVIADAWPGRGLGEILLHALIQAAVAAGVKELTGWALSSNVSISRLASKLGFSSQRDPISATMTRFRMPLQPTHVNSQLRSLVR